MDRIGNAQLLLGRLFHPAFDLLDQRNLLSYIAAAAFVFMAAVASRLARRGGGFRLRALVRLIFRKSVWLHPSARLDYRLFALNLVLQTFVLGVLVAGSNIWAELAGRGLTALAGPAETTTGNDWGIVAVVALVQLLAFDFGYWLGHTMQHRSALLWEFHKVHHSALVMTPATEFRQHPVELVLMPTVIGVVVGLAYALTTHWLGTGAPALGQVPFNLVILLHLMTFHHLRHSHIDMAFTGVWGRLLHSPAHHRLHHSANPAHFDRNMGYMLSVWDWMAGTLVVPRRGQRLTLGIGAEGAAHNSVASAMWLPVRGAWRLAGRRKVVAAPRF